MQACQYRIARPTNRLSEIIHFYQHILGLPVIGRFSGHAGYDGIMLELPGSNCHLEFTQHENGSPCPAPTKDNLLVLYFDKPETYEDTLLHMTRAGLKPVEPENPYWLSTSETFEDPDGWRVVLYNGCYKP